MVLAFFLNLLLFSKICSLKLLLYRNFAFIIPAFNLPDSCRVNIHFSFCSSVKIEKSVWACESPQTKHITNRTIGFLFQSISKKEMYEVCTAKKNIQNKNRSTPAQMLSKIFKFSFYLGPMSHFRNMAVLGE